MNSSSYKEHLPGMQKTTKFVFVFVCNQRKTLAKERWELIIYQDFFARLNILKEMHNYVKIIIFSWTFDVEKLLKESLDLKENILFSLDYD